MTVDNTARLVGWDGKRANTCDHIECEKPPVVHFEITTGGEWASESDLCAEHLEFIGNQARAFAVAVGAIAPTTELDHNIRTAASEAIGAE